MNSSSDMDSAVFGVVLAAPVVWGIVRIANDRRRLRAAIPAGFVAACLWLPFGWLILLSGAWNDYRLSWLKMWPYLPGFLPGALLFHPQHDALQFATMAATTLLLLIALTWLGCRGRRGLLAAVVVALVISSPSALVAYTAFRA